MGGVILIILCRMVYKCYKCNYINVVLSHVQRIVVITRQIRWTRTLCRSNKQKSCEKHFEVTFETTNYEEINANYSLSFHHGSWPSTGQNTTIVTLSLPNTDNHSFYPTAKYPDTWTWRIVINTWLDTCDCCHAICQTLSNNVAYLRIIANKRDWRLFGEVERLLSDKLSCSHDFQL